MLKDSNRSVFIWLNEVTGVSKILVAALLVIQIILGLISTLYAISLREIVNNAVDKVKDAFFISVIFFICLVLVQILIKALNRFVEEFARATIENQLKKRLFSTILNRKYEYVSKVHSGEWMNRMTSDTTLVADGMVQILPGMIGMFVKIIGALTAIMFIEPYFLYILIPGGIILIFFTYFFRKVLKRLYKKMRTADGEVRIFLSERIINMLIIKAFSQEDTVLNQSDILMNNYKSERMRRNHFSNICNVGFSMAMNGAYVLGAIVCGHGILTDSMSYGDMMAILQLIVQIQNPFANITGYMPKFYAMTASAERLMEAEKYSIDIKEIIPLKTVSDFYENHLKALILENVYFTYKDSERNESSLESVLSNFSLEIRKGDYIAITGSSGCGKSTILKILMCLYPLDAGNVFILADKSNYELTPEWRGLFAYVPQGNQLLCGTIREIITFGDKHKMNKDNELYMALKIACADDFVSKLKDGLDTVLGERGSGLSEGQIQRIAIARAIFSDRPIILLDEATSSLDENIEQNVLNNIRLMTNKTVIIVTHRPSALGICNKQIKFINDGVVII